ncbi:MAG: carboxypeptidase regulatory-like domain-containing protein [Thermoplasmata archaeon]|nr:carboxypeptidase regulatory-like domain-containing protein [Thermoplasmata archaeon]
MEVIAALLMVFIPATPGFTAPARITGVVVDAEGTPVGGATVVLDTGERTTTNIVGMFIFDGVEPGLRRVTALSNGETGTAEVFSARYLSGDLVVVLGEDRPIPSYGVSTWEDLRGLFYGAALVCVTAAAVSAYTAYTFFPRRPVDRRHPSTFIISGVLGMVAALFVMGNGTLASIFSFLLFLLSFLLIVFSARVVLYRRRRMLAGI